MGVMTDPYLWLEDVEGEAQLAWARERNDEAMRALGTERYRELEADIRAVLDSDERIPEVVQRGEHLYNFWRDADHERGLWRRTTWESYLSGEPEWDVIIDVDALADDEGVSWVWDGAEVLYPSRTKALISLSRGGADASTEREFDLESRTFVDGGFVRPESKGAMTWADTTGDEVLVFTDFGEGSMTPSGYPRIVKRWRRGTPLEEAVTLYEGEADDMYIGGYFDHTPGYERTFISRAITFYTNQLIEVRGGELHPLELPDSAEAFVWRDWLLVQLRDDWQPGEETFAAGSLLAVDYEQFIAGGRDFVEVFTPTATASIAGLTATASRLLLTLLDDVRNRVVVATPADGRWVFSDLEIDGVGEFDTISVRAVDAVDSDDVWVTTAGFLTPTTLMHVTADGASTTVRQLPAFFDATGMSVAQHFATSDDGTRIPYFLVSPASVPSDGPTLLSGYGGFEVPRLPSYSPAMARAWLSRGGTYVLANIRGGGEYGPAWHQAALKQHRHRAYEDFAAVARDLVDRGITTRERLGTQGGSNGGLLMGNMLTQYADLFGAIVCQVPLLDMQRYSHLLAGASWMAEYGDPDVPEEWEFIRTFSPYHLAKPDQDYPPVLFTTSTRDDRVHPGHARKMAEKLRDWGYDVTYFENIEGGHGGAATNAQAAMMQALSFEFLWQRVGR